MWLSLVLVCLNLGDPTQFHLPFIPISLLPRSATHCLFLSSELAIFIWPIMSFIGLYVLNIATIHLANGASAESSAMLKNKPIQSSIIWLANTQRRPTLDNRFVVGSYRKSHHITHTQQAIINILDTGQGIDAQLSFHYGFVLHPIHVVRYGVRVTYERLPSCISY